MIGVFLVVGAALAQDPAKIPGRQCAAFLLSADAVRPTERVGSPDRAPTVRAPSSEERTATERAERPTERVASEEGTPNQGPVGLTPLMQRGSMASLPDGWVPVGGGPAVVPVGRVGDTQYYEVQNYVIACEVLDTVRPLGQDAR